jgi:hypothetical protein
MYYLCIINTIPMVYMAGYSHTNGQDVALVEDTHTVVSLLSLRRRALRRIAEIFTEEKVFFQSRKQEWTSPVPK